MAGISTPEPFEQAEQPDRGPVDDATKPIAPPSNAADTPGHVALIERLRHNLGPIERTRHGVLLALPATADNAADLRPFAAEAKRGCEFWGFEVIEGTELLVARGRPPETSEFMDRWSSTFEGRQPIGALVGPLTSSLTGGRT